MSENDLFLYLATVALFSFNIFSFLLFFKQIQGLKNDLRVIKSDISTLFHDVQDLKTAQKNYDIESYEKIIKKLAVNAQDVVSLDHKVRALDGSIKDFYSRWARKLGLLQKRLEEENAEDSGNYPDNIVGLQEMERPSQRKSKFRR